MSENLSSKKEGETYSVWDSGWTMRIRPPLEPGSPQVIILLHGWTGDENSMQIFAPWLPPTAALIFPRAPIHAQPAGYGWLPHSPFAGPSIQDFVHVSQALCERIDGQVAELGLQTSRISLVGFSQGAAFALAFCALFPTRVDRTAVLAGFLPSGMTVEFTQAFSAKPFYVAHGTKDETIPVEQAHRIRIILEDCGAHVTYCESNTGHKLSIACLKKLADFYRPA